MGRWRTGLVATLFFACGACGDEELVDGACVVPFSDQPVCFDRTLDEPCDGRELDDGCIPSGYTVAVDDCAVHVAGTEGGYVEPGMCPPRPTDGRTGS